MKGDKRRRTRTPVHFDAVILLGSTEIREAIINISLNGLLCTSNPLFQPDASCTVMISLSEDVRIVIAAKISRAGEKETAIRFLSMDDESFLHLKKLVQYNLGDADRVDRELRKQAFGGA